MTALPRLARTASLVGVLACLAAAPPAGAMTGTNLVAQGDGETVPGAAWVLSAGGLTRAAYGAGGYPGPVLIGGGTFAGGSYLLHGTGASTVATQTIALGADDRAAVATGTVRARLSAHLGGYNAQNDRIGATATWRDAGGDVVLQQDLAPVTAAERGNVAGFLARADEQPVPAGAASVAVTLTGTRVEGSAQDGYADNVALHLIGIPGLTVATAGKATAGRPTPVTWTVANSEDLRPKPGWRFTAALPAGVAVAASSAVTTTCAGARVTAHRTSIAVDGALPAGGASCTLTAAVVADEGRHVFAPDDVRDASGLRPPTVPATLEAGAAGGDPGSGATGPDLPPAAAPPAPTVLTPVLPDPPPTALPPAVPPSPAPTTPAPRAAAALRVRVSGPPSRLRSGRRTAVRVRVENRTARPLTNVDVCVRLPRGLLYLPTRSGAEPVAGRRCWTLRRLPARAARSMRLDARATRPGRATVRVSAAPAEAAGEAVADRTTRVTR